VQATGNHQVKYQPKVVIQTKYDSLSDATKLAHGPAARVFNRRLGSSQEKWAIQPYALQRLAYDAGFECANIGGDIWQFRHRVTDCTLSSCPATSWRGIDFPLEGCLPQFDPLR
jgi:hypothetical protein